MRQRPRRQSSSAGPSPAPPARMRGVLHLPSLPPPSLPAADDVDGRFLTVITSVIALLLGLLLWLVARG